jgi:hypothetical protein
LGKKIVWGRKEHLQNFGGEIVEKCPLVVREELGDNIREIVRAGG